MKTAQTPAFLIYAVAAALTILFAHWCRLVIARAKQQERAHQIVARELAHRSRNSAAVIQAIIQKTLQDQPERAETILGRVRAAHFSNELLVQGQRQMTDLHVLLNHEFAAYGGGRTSMRGPSVEVSPDQARTLIMILRELTTNAAKYGALSNTEGAVLVGW